MGHGRGGLFVLLALGILLPGVILAVFGFRSLQQDRLLAERQNRDALESAAGLASREVARDLTRWREWNEPGSATITLAPSGVVKSVCGLLWWPAELPPPAALGDAARAEAAEVREKDFQKALVLYEGALRGAPAATKAELLLKMARTAKKAGDIEGARRIWRLILSLPASPTTAAARLALIESGEGSAVDFYRELTGGRFLPARETYWYYSTRARELAGESAAEQFREQQSRGIALTKAAEAFLSSPRRIPSPGFVALWDDHTAVLLADSGPHNQLAKAAQAGLGR